MRGRPKMAANVSQPRAVADCGAFICQAKIRKLRKREAKIQRTNGNSFWVLLPAAFLFGRLFFLSA